MNQRSGRARILESAIGIVFLFHLVVIVVVLLVIQSRFDLSRFGVGQTAVAGQQSETSNPLQAVEKSGFSLNSLSSKDLSPVGKTEIYNNDNLYEKIDGKAPMYQDTGFVKLTTQRLSSAKNADWGLELYLYDMGNAKNAFSVYSRQKRADVVDMNDVPLGYKTTNAVYVCDGKYYIEMIGFAESQELVTSMTGFAKNLISQLPTGEKDKIAELGFFPPGTVAGTCKLQITDAFGFDGLKDTYSALYPAAEKRVSIFFSNCASDAEAAKSAKSYNDFLISNGAKPVPVSSDVLKSANTSVVDLYGNTEIVFAVGPFVAGVHEADDKQAALKVAEVLLEHLKTVSGKISG